MKIFKTLLLSLCALTFFCACSSHDDEEVEKKPASRTVLIYMCAENNLDPYYAEDYREILQGCNTIPDNVNLILFADRQSKNEKPFLAKCDKHGVNKVKIYDEDFYCVDKDKIKEVMSWVKTNYPAESYGLTFWGHANGWIQVADEYVSPAKQIKMTGRAYGYDDGTDLEPIQSKGRIFINIQDLSQVISECFPKLDFLFFDCCQMMSAEALYELRNTARYIVGSPAEIPASGAPYNIILPDFFLAKEKVGPAIVDHYIQSLRRDGLPLTVVDTDRLNDFTYATAEALATFMPDYAYPKELDLKGLIYYSESEFLAYCEGLHDVRDLMRKYLSEEAFTKWDDVFQKMIVYSSYPNDEKQQGLSNWMTAENINFSSFKMTKDNFGGISIFIPQNYYDYASTSCLNPNRSIFKMSWTNVVDWSKYGWRK